MEFWPKLNTNSGLYRFRLFWHTAVRRCCQFSATVASRWQHRAPDVVYSIWPSLSQTSTTVKTILLTIIISLT